MAGMKTQHFSECVESLRGELIDLAQQLVRQPSVTGDEAAAQQVLSKVLNDWGLKVDLWQPGAEEIRNHPAYCDDGLPVGRPNLVARWGEQRSGEFGRTHIEWPYRRGTCGRSGAVE